jgi:hypothetical protein
LIESIVALELLVGERRLFLVVMKQAKEVAQVLLMC